MPCSSEYTVNEWKLRDNATTKWMRDHPASQHLWYCVCNKVTNLSFCVLVFSGFSTETP